MTHIVILALEWLLVMLIGGALSGAIYVGAKRIRLVGSATDKQRALLDAEAEEAHHNLAVKRFQHRQQLLALTSGSVEVPKKEPKAEEADFNREDITEPHSPPTFPYEPTEVASYKDLKASRENE